MLAIGQVGHRWSGFRNVHLAMQTSARAQTNRDILIQDNVEMARRMARRLARRLPGSVSREDVESAALLGLTEAASRYDSDRNEPFMAFAAKRVRGAILDHLRTSDVLSRRGRQAARRVATTERALEAERGRPVTESEIAAKMGMSETEFHQSYSRLRSVSMVQLDDMTEPPLSVTSGTPTECSERQQMRAALARAMEALEPREKIVLVCYYRKGMTLRAIGKLLGVTESRVCQIHTRAIEVLRAQMS